jgi:predicted NBD/HSP70 family sugar kinase
MSDETARRRKAKNLQYIRKSNRAEIFRSLAAGRPATRLELADQLGLSKMAISNIIKELMEGGLVCETNPGITKHSANPGRRSDRLVLCRGKFSAIGIYLSRDAIHGILSDINGQIHDTWHEDLDLAENLPGEKQIRDIENSTVNSDRLKNILADFADRIKADLAEKWHDIKPLGLGICSIGPMDIQSGTLLNPPNFYGIEMFNLKQFLAEHFELPVIIDNDMNAAVWAEHMYGAAQGRQHVLYLGLSNGIGAGILAYGRIFQGSAGFGGEVGHLSINFDGPHCSCGQNGCLETYLSLPVILAKTGTGCLADLLVKTDDSKFRQLWLPGYLETLTRGLVNLANVFDPETILIGHEGAVLVKNSIGIIENSVNQQVFQKRAKKVRIRIAGLGENAPLQGSAALVFQALFRGDLEP